jgi:Protein of unknown function (DUF3185)
LPSEGIFYRGFGPQEPVMSPQRIVGIVLLVLGVGLLVVGMNASHSVADQVSNTFLGRFTQTTTWYLLGGVVSGVLGLVLMAGPPAKSA